MTFDDEDDWDGPIPPEHHPMLSPEMRRRLAEELPKIRLKVEEERAAERREVIRVCLFIFLTALGAFACWTYGSESLSLMSTIWTSITNMI